MKHGAQPAGKAIDAATNGVAVTQAVA